MGKIRTQIGIMAMRKPNGEFMEAKPIYGITTPKMKARAQRIDESLDDIMEFYMYKYIEAIKNLEMKKE